MKSSEFILGETAYKNAKKSLQSLIGIEDMIFGNDVDTLQPMTKQRLFAAAKEIQRRDKYVTL